MEAAWSNMQFAPSYQQAASYANLRLNLVSNTGGAGSSSSSNDVATYASHARSHSLDSLEPPTKRTRQNWYPSEEARLEARKAQKDRRREQNRNAQRRLRDRKEEHIFNLEGEVSRLRKQHEQQRVVESDLEHMLRRLVKERDELQRRLSISDSISSPSTTTVYAGRARSSSAHAFLPSLKMEPSDNTTLRSGLSGYQRSAVLDDVICESPDGEADSDQETTGYPLSAMPFAQAAYGRMRSLSLHMPKPPMLGQSVTDIWSPSALPNVSLHLDRRAVRASDSPRDSEPLSAHSSASRSTNSSMSIATTPPSSAQSNNVTALESVMLTHPARWDGN